MRCPTAPGYAGRAVRPYRCLRDEQSNNSLVEVSDEGWKNHAKSKKRNADTSPLTTTALIRRGFSSGRERLFVRSNRRGGLGALARPGQGCRRSEGEPLRWELEARWEILLTLGLVQYPWITAPSGTPRSALVEGVRTLRGPRPIDIFLLTCDGKSVPILEIAQKASGRHAAGTGATVLRGRLAGRPSTMIEEGEGIADRRAHTSIPSALLSGSTR